ncbi:MAG: ABC transporter permease, partial [Longimicrobiales bacterium]
METLLRDLRIAARALRRSPGFAVIAILTLALGIGANTAVFSVVDAVLLRPLPYPEPEEIVQIRHVDGDGDSQLNMSFPNYFDLRERSRSFDEMAVYSAGTTTTSGQAGASRVEAAAVTASFFDVLGVRPALGRTFGRDEGVADVPVIVVGRGYWQTRLGGETSLRDAVVRIGDRAYQVIGVMPAGFSFPDETQVWVPSGATLANQNRTAHNFHMIGRLRESATLARAQDDLSAVARRLAAEYGDDTSMADALVVPLRDELVGSARPALLIISGAAAFLLLIVCANVVNLLLARLASRDRELSIRQALGAGRRRLAGQFLTEALLLALIGGALGVVLAIWGVPALLALEPGGLPRVDGVG